MLAPDLLYDYTSSCYKTTIHIAKCQSSECHLVHSMERTAARQRVTSTKLPDMISPAPRREQQSMRVKHCLQGVLICELRPGWTLPLLLVWNCSTTVLSGTMQTYMHDHMQSCICSAYQCTGQLVGRHSRVLQSRLVEYIECHWRSSKERCDNKVKTIQ